MIPDQNIMGHAQTRADLRHLRRLGRRPVPQAVIHRDRPHLRPQNGRHLRRQMQKRHGIAATRNGNPQNRTLKCTQGEAQQPCILALFLQPVVRDAVYWHPSPVIATCALVA